MEAKAHIADTINHDASGRLTVTSFQKFSRDNTVKSYITDPINDQMSNIVGRDLRA